ncbi:MAG TPA: ABC transporter permease [Candidatus Poseidoniia archaeon]|jgi:ABC-type transport system involved in multi-copper enzyme maturation permease subunit|nr:ABC transporter permease [Candidatus Poseidoniia archaeon]|tara:strand:+ start:3250 stop:4158 length:909 start_codon:yes stop_codon:yes gene_type:complete
MEIIGEISKMPATIQSLAKRSVNLFPPIAKDCTHRLLVNKVTWVIIAILLLPCILGLVIYYETNNDRQVQEIDGEKIYYTNDGALIHEEKREDYEYQSNLIVISFVAIIMAILFSSELINEEYENKTMQLLRTTPIHSFEILLHRYLAGVICMFGILGIHSILFYYTTMIQSGTHGILENLDVLLTILKVLIFESIAFMAVFCVFAIYFEKPFLIGIIYWIVWEGFVSGQNYQKITITHYLNSILFDSTKAMGWKVKASDYNLINSKEEIIATEPLIAMIVILIVAIVALIIGSRGLANRQF